MGDAEAGKGGVMDGLVYQEAITNSDYLQPTGNRYLKLPPQCGCRIVGKIDFASENQIFPK